MTLNIITIINECHCAECRVSFFVMLNVIMLIVIMLIVILLIVIMLIVIMLIVVMLRVVAPNEVLFLCVAYFIHYSLHYVFDVES
jgi:hypothetical protein